ncbi:TetR/AcrR family transcriptional regulator [Leptobacterium sp. I13]|uniref:TetR/AcrR family transcriptional regulator n=1 Tax=Leptobacterium meishanense TaxID=3128904 RepID=UPI0030EF8BFC
MRQKYTTEEILEKGLEVMILKGYNYSGLNELLKVSDIPKGSFYNHFKSKEDFGAQLIQFYGAKLYAHLESYVNNKELSPLNRIKTFYTDLIKVMARRGYTCGCLIGNMSQEVGDLNTTLSNAVNNELKKTKYLLEQTIKEAQEAGEVKNTDASEWADYIQNNWHGALLRMKTEQSEKPLQLFMEYTFSS